MSKSRVVFFRRDGSMLAEIDCYTTRSWILSDYGQADITISLNEPKLDEDLVNYGNYVAIISDSTELWAGVIYPPRKWDHKELSITAYSGEFLLKLLARREEDPDGDPPLGEMAAFYIMTSPRDSGVSVKIGSIEYTDQKTNEFKKDVLLYEAIQDVSTAYGEEWSVLPVLTNENRLQFFFNWYTARGLYLPDFFLEEGHNLTAGTVLEEQGPLYNDLQFSFEYHYRGPPRWTETHRGNVTSGKSISKFGRMSFAGTLSGEYGEGRPNSATAMKKQLAQVSWPRRTYKATALNVNDSFLSLQIGNVVRLRCSRLGFLPGGTLGTDTKVRIIGKAYSDLEGDQLELTLDSVEQQ